jgi:hypothetical protein
MASSKLVFDDELISVTFATDISDSFIDEVARNPVEHGGNGPVPSPL